MILFKVIINHSYFGSGLVSAGFYYLSNLLPYPPLAYLSPSGLTEIFFKHDSGLAVSGNISSYLRNYSPSAVSI